MVLTSLSAAGSSPWISLNYLQNPFGVSLAVLLTTGASLTYGVQHTYDDITDQSVRFDGSIARSGTTATLTMTAHKLLVGDTIIVDNSGSTALDCQKDSGQRPIPWQIATVADANTATFTVANSGPAASASGVRIKILRVFPHFTLTGQTARADGNYAFPPQACRLVVTNYVSGTADLIITQGLGT